MADAWPGTLPCEFTMESRSEGMGDGRIRHQPDRGPAIVRLGSSAAPNALTGQMSMTAAQWATLRTFVQTTLIGGSLPFLFPDSSGDLVRFGERLPARRRMTGSTFIVDITLEVMP